MCVQVWDFRVSGPVVIPLLTWKSPHLHLHKPKNCGSGNRVSDFRVSGGTPCMFYPDSTSATPSKTVFFGQHKLHCLIVCTAIYIVWNRKKVDNFSLVTFWFFCQSAWYLRKWIPYNIFCYTFNLCGVHGWLSISIGV